VLPRKQTYEDHSLILEDGQRHEILGGEHYVEPSPSFRHQAVSSRLHVRLGSHVEERKAGIVLSAPMDVILSADDIAQPDLLFISNERAGIITLRNIKGAPDLVVEILSQRTRRRDEGIKRELYDRCGVPEYWIVDPQRKATKVYRRQGENLRLTATFSAATDAVLTTPLLPGLAIPLAEIFK